MLDIKKSRGITSMVIAIALSLTLTGCGSISGAVKSILAEDTFPTLPSPEITTYVLDLSGSTNAIAQLNALNSGIDEFTSGKSLGNPFSNPKVKPRGLSMQFITLSSGQAPRFLLVSAAAVKELYSDPFVKNRKGIFEFILGGRIDTKLIDVRVFDEATKRSTYEIQTAISKVKGISNCPLCALGNEVNKDKIWPISEMDADHISAWSKGGATVASNCEMLCKTHNRSKGNR